MEDDDANRRGFKRAGEPTEEEKSKRARLLVDMLPSDTPPAVIDGLSELPMEMWVAISEFLPPKFGGAMMQVADRIRKALIDRGTALFQTFYKARRAALAAFDFGRHDPAQMLAFHAAGGGLEELHRLLQSGLSHVILTEIKAPVLATAVLYSEAARYCKRTPGEMFDNLYTFLTDLREKGLPHVPFAYVYCRYFMRLEPMPYRNHPSHAAFYEWFLREWAGADAVDMAIMTVNASGRLQHGIYFPFVVGLMDRYINDHLRTSMALQKAVSQMSFMTRIQPPIVGICRFWFDPAYAQDYERVAQQALPTTLLAFLSRAETMRSSLAMVDNDFIHEAIQSWKTRLAKKQY